jgi:hypothetical protein
VHHHCFQNRRGDGRRGIGAHAAGVRAGVAVADALVVLRRRQRNRGLAVAQYEEGRLLAGQKFLHHHFRTGLAQTAAEHHVDRGFCFGNALRHNHALAQSKTIGLYHDRIAKLFRETQCFGALLKCTGHRGWNAGVSHNLLRKNLRGLQPSRCLRWSKDSQPRFFEHIDDSSRERIVRSHDRQMNAVPFCKSNELSKIGRRNRNVFADLRRSRISRRAKNPFDRP